MTHESDSLMFKSITICLNGLNHPRVSEVMADYTSTGCDVLKLSTAFDSTIEDVT